MEEEIMENKNILTIKELSEIISIKPSTLYSWSMQKKIPFIKIGKKVLFDLAEVMVWIESHKKIPKY